MQVQRGRALRMLPTLPNDSGYTQSPPPPRWPRCDKGYFLQRLCCTVRLPRGAHNVGVKKCNVSGGDE